MTPEDRSRIEADARETIEQVMSRHGKRADIPPEDVEKAVRQLTKVSMRHAQAAARHQAFVERHRS